MRPSRQQPDLTALPPTQGMPVSPGSSQYFGQADGQDTQMEDAMYAESIPEESPIKENGRGLNLNFLMSKAKTTKDGVPAKKRGPKRDSKPAISRRQELNRQAQRTHRERKEFYTKTLELDVGRLRERFAQTIKDNQMMQQQLQAAARRVNDLENMRHENERLKQLLTVNGITFDRLVVLNNQQQPTSQPPTSQPQTPAYPTNQMQYAQSQHQHQQLHQHQHQHPHQHPQQHPQQHGLPQQQPHFIQHNHARHHPANNQQFQPGPSHQTSYIQQQHSVPISPVDAHPAYRQQHMVGSMPAFSQRDHQQGMSTSSSLTTSSQISPAEVSPRGAQNQIPRSASGSSGYGSSVATPVSASASDRPSPTASTAVSRQTSRQESNGTIDTLISPASAMFPPSNGQGHNHVNAAVDIKDERIKKEALERDQLGVQFVLALEENCKDHQQYLNIRANPPQEQDMNYELSGHAMMLTNPPPSHIEKCPNEEYHQAPNIPANNLLELMETAQRLPLNGGEIPPILALRIIREDERYQMLTRRQFKALTEKLRESSRCYGFGAVLEQYEVSDALNSVFESFDSIELNDRKPPR